jgi:hypothetical protein
MAETKWLPKMTYHLKAEPVVKWHLKTCPDFKCFDHLKTELEKVTFQMFPVFRCPVKA